MPDVGLSSISFEITGKADHGVESIERTTTALLNLKKAISNFSGKRFSTQIEKLSASFDKLNQAINGKGNELDQTASRLHSVAVELERIANASKNVNLGKVMRDMSKQKPLDIPKLTPGEAETPADIEPSTSDFDTSDVYDLNSAMGILSGMTRVLLQDIANVGKTGAHAFASIAKGAWNAASAVGTRVWESFTDRIKKADKALSGLGRAFARIAMYRFLRTLIKEITQGIKEGIDNMYQWSLVADTTFSNSMNRMATSALYLKNSLGAMLAPVINALVPIIDAVVDRIVSMINVINQLLALITGASYWTAAVKAQTKYADAVTGSKKAVDKLKLTIASFDELHILKNPDDKTGGGGGKAVPNYAGMFKNMPFDKTLKDLIDNQDWKGLGQYLGNKVNEFIDSVPWAELGAKFGRAFNGVIQTLYWFLDTIDWYNLSKHLSEFINNAVENVDFTYLGRLWTKKFTIMGDMIIGAIQNINWGGITGALSDIFIGRFDEFSKWIAGYNWFDVGSSIFDALYDAITGIKYGELASSLFKAFGSAVGALAGTIVGFLSDAGITLANNIADYFKPYTKGVGIEVIKGIGKGILDALKNVGEWIINNIWKPFIDGVKSAFGIASPAKTMEPVGEDIIGGMFVGIKNFWKNVTDWFETAKNSILTVWENIKGKTSEVWGNITTVAGNAWSTLKSGASEKFESIRSTVSSKWDTLKSNTSTVWNTIKTSLGTAWSTLQGNAKSSFDTVSAIVRGDWDKVKSDTSTRWSTIKTTLTSAWNTVKSNASSAFQNVVTTVKDKLNTAWSTISSMVTKFKNAFNFKVSFPTIRIPHIQLPHFRIDGAFSLNPPSVPSFSIDWYKEGGILEDGLFTMNHGELAGKFANGQSVVANNEQIIEGIKRGVIEAMSTVDRGNDRERVLNIQIDGDTLFKVVVDKNNRAVSMNGESPLLV